MWATVLASPRIGAAQAGYDSAIDRSVNGIRKPFDAKSACLLSDTDFHFHLPTPWRINAVFSLRKVAIFAQNLPYLTS